MHKKSLFYLLIIFPFTQIYCSQPPKKHTKITIIPIHPHSTQEMTDLEKINVYLKQIGFWCNCQNPYCAARIKIYQKLISFKKAEPALAQEFKHEL